MTDSLEHLNEPIPKELYPLNDCVSRSTKIGLSGFLVKNKTEAASLHPKASF